MKYALIVGINTYAKHITESALRGCVLDANRMLDQCLKDMHYMYMADKAATKQAVINALKAYAERLQPGDTLYYYQSGHGTYREFAGRRMTGRVMYDAVMWDYDFIEALKAFKGGVKVVTISDCCFAESNSRLARVPGTTGKYIPNPESTTERGVTQNRTSFAGVKCALVEISASKLEQTAQEVYGHPTFENGGVFTTVLLRYFQDCSVKSLISKAKLDTRPFGQTPVVATRKAKGAVELPLMEI